MLIASLSVRMVARSQVGVATARSGYGMPTQANRSGPSQDIHRVSPAWRLVRMVARSQAVEIGRTRPFACGMWLQVENIKTLEHTEPVYSVAFSPDGRTLASASGDSTIRLWNTNTGTLIRTFTGHRGWVSSIAFSPDGRTLASASGDQHDPAMEYEYRRTDPHPHRTYGL